MKNRLNQSGYLMTLKDAFLLIKVIILCVFLLFAAKISLGQTTASLTRTEFSNAFQNENIIPKRDKSAKIKSFNVISKNGKAHLSWVTKNQVKEGTYIIERSFDGEHFEVIGLKKGIPSKTKRKVIFQYVNLETEKYSHYRIKHIANDNSVLVSEKIRPVYVIEDEESSLSGEKADIN